MTKDDAYEEAMRRWHELPPAERQTFEQAQVFAASLAEELDFRTMGNERKVIAAWLVRAMTAAADERTERPFIGPRLPETAEA